MGKKLFISYNHEQREWVRTSLLPILKASGTEYYIDLERMKGGVPVTAQTDCWQDDADIHVLCFSRDYLKSGYCIHETERALGYDPDFSGGRVLPVKLEECELPKPFTEHDPFWIDFTTPCPDSWNKFLTACDIAFPACPIEWLAARDKIVRYLARKESINLILKGEPAWRKLLEHIEEYQPITLGKIDFDTWGINSWKGFVRKVLHSWGITREIPDEPDDLVLLDEVIEELDIRSPGDGPFLSSLSRRHSSIYSMIPNRCRQINRFWKTHWISPLILAETHSLTW